MSSICWPVGIYQRNGKRTRRMHSTDCHGTPHRVCVAAAAATLLHPVPATQPWHIVQILWLSVRKSVSRAVAGLKLSSSFSSSSPHGVCGSVQYSTGTISANLSLLPLLPIYVGTTHGIISQSQWVVLYLNFNYYYYYYYYCMWPPHQC